MRDENPPMMFWDYCTKQRDLISNIMAKDIFQLRGNAPYFATFGEEGKISNIYQLGWYKWFYFHEASVDFHLP